MSVGEIAGLIAAGAFVLLVVIVAIPLLKLGRTLDETTLTIRQAREQSAPILAQAQPAAQKVDSSAKRPPADAHAEARRDSPAPSHRRPIRAARRHYQRLPPASSTWASAGPSAEPSWSWNW